MFTIQCTTCNAKLSVRNEELIGQILACPKCGGMVLVQPPEENVVPVIFKKFPDLLTSETASGIIGAVPEHLEPLEQLNPPTPPPIPLSETELRTRKMLLSILAGLFLFLIVAVGVLIVVKGNRSDEIPVNPVKQSDIDQPTIEQPATEQAAAEQPEIAQPVPVPSTEVAKPQEKTTPEVAHAQTETPTTEKSTTETPSTPTTTIPTAETATVSSLTEDDDGTRLAALLDKTPKEPEIRSTTDLLSDLEKKMPGLVPPLAFSLDIPTRLAIPLTGLKLDKTPLLKVIRLLSDLTEIPMTFDMEEMRPRGIQIDAPLTAQFDAGNVGDILSKILATFELEPVIEDRQILITVSPERRNTLSERTFDVADLVENTKNSADPLTPEHLAEILQRLVDPTNDAFIRVEGQSLIIQNRFRLLDESLRVLEQLRVIRKLSQKTDVVGEFLAPEAFGWDAAMAPLTLNYYQPTPLSGIFSQLESTTNLHILVDHKALHRVLSPLLTMKATVQCNQGTVHEALEKLLASVEVAPLTYRIVSHNSFEITTEDAARQPDKMSIEVHRFTGETPEELVRTIRSALEPGSWRLPDDPETMGRGDIMIDRSSGCLLIRQSQPIQRQIRLWLGNQQTTE